MLHHTIELFLGFWYAQKLINYMLYFLSKKINYMLYIWCIFSFFFYYCLEGWCTRPWFNPPPLLVLIQGSLFWGVYCIWASWGGDIRKITNLTLSLNIIFGYLLTSPFRGEGWIVSVDDLKDNFSHYIYIFHWIRKKKGEDRMVLLRESFGLRLKVLSNHYEKL